MSNAAATVSRPGWWHRLDSAGGGLSLDLGIYASSAAFAAITAATSALPSHRHWGTLAALGYLAAALLVIGQLLVHRQRPDSALVGIPARWLITSLAWGAAALLPLIWQSIQRAAGRTDRAQEEVLVVEESGRRLLETGTPYLGPDAIAALPPGEQLLGYTPYQPGMALFGLPRALHESWWTDARVWFAAGTALALVLALHLLRSAPDRPARDPALLLGAGQAATVLPICALTLATGGDDLPVLALCLLALAFAGSARPGWAGIMVGLAGALKLFAWPVAMVLVIWGLTRRSGLRVAAGAFGLPAAVLLPILLVDHEALVENVLRFPLGQGLVASPAQSPFPGYLIATNLPAGRAVAAALLVAAGLAIAVQLARRPPRTARSISVICGYGLLTAILLMPTTRFGYLLYPIAFLVWATVLDLPGSGNQRAETRCKAYT